MSIILKSMYGYFGPLLLCLQRRLSQLYESIEIINGILPCCQSISALNAHVWRNSLQTEVEIIATNPLCACGIIASVIECWLCFIVSVSIRKNSS